MTFLSTKRIFALIFLITLAKLNLAQDVRKIDSLQKLVVDNKLEPEKKAKLYYSIAKCYLHVDDIKATAYADSAIQIAEKTGNKKIKAESYSIKGVIFKNKGLFEKAIEHHLIALKIKEELRDTMGKAISYNDIGVLYKVLKNYNKALEYYRISNQFCRQINLGKGIAQTYNNIGTIYSELKQLDSSFVYYQLALGIAEKIGSKAAISTVCNNIGEYYGNKNDNKMALIFFKRSLEMDVAEQNIYGMIMSYINIGGAYTLLKNYEDALANFVLAEQLCIKNEERPLLKDLYWSMSQCYAQSNNKTLAYDYLLKHKVIADSIQSKEISQNILDIETKYQTEKKDLELSKNKAELLLKEEEAKQKNILFFSIISLAILLTMAIFLFYRKKQIQQKAELDAEISAQKELRAKSIIEAEEKERIRIATDLHDGVGQLLSAAKLNLSSLENKINLSDAGQQTAFQNAVSLVDDSVKEVRSVSHNMMPNTLLKLGLASAVKEFVTKIQGTPNLKVNLEIVGLNNRLEQEKETVIYRVIQEVVSNIIKHAKATELTLQIIKHDHELSIMIEDNGVGFDTSKINSFEGIGLKNILSRVEFINGTVHFDSAIGRGTTVIIELKTT